MIQFRHGLLAGLLLFSAPATASDFQAQVTYLKGIARHQAKGKKKYTSLSLGDAVLEGGTVVTLDSTKVELRFEDGTITRLGSNTKFVLEKMERTAMGGVKSLFSILSGRLWFTMAKLTGDSDVRTKTPTVVAAVKGTVWRADVGEDGETDIVVYDGVVAATPEGGRTVSIKPMEKLAAMPNASFEKGAYNDMAEQKDDWIRWNQSRDKLRVMIILTEQRGDEKATSSVSENAAIGRFLDNYLFKVIEKEQVDRIREGAKLKAALKGDDAAAAAAGLEVAADLIIVGEAKAKYFTNPALGGFISATANIVARAVRADTAEVISTSTGISARAVDITDEGAAHKALIQAGEKAASKFVDSILEKWKREIRKGAALDVVVTGVDYKKLKVVTNALAKVKGVKNVESLYLVGERSLLNVTFSGDSTALADAIQKAAFGALKVSIVGLSAYKLELDVASADGDKGAGES